MKTFLQQEMGLSDVRLLCPLADAPRWLLEQVEVASVEDVIRQECCKARRVIADPIYARLLPDEKEKFVSMPHEAYSGRHYHADMPIFVGPSFTAWMKEKLT